MLQRAVPFLWILSTAGFAQAPSHDALAHARAKARFENQHVLLHLAGGEPAEAKALEQLIGNYRALGKLVRYEYQLVALPAGSSPARATLRKLKVDGLTAPALVVIDTKDRVLGRLDGADVNRESVSKLLETHKCAPRDARKVLADGIARANKTQRRTLVYLSAPW